VPSTDLSLQDIETMKGLVLVNGGGGAAVSGGGLLCGMMMRVSSIRSRASWASPVDIESDRIPATLPSFFGHVPYALKAAHERMSVVVRQVPYAFALRASFPSGKMPPLI
jgi:hypothetical protein